MGISRMTYALGEIETLCRKAARGAGHSWGVAEEAGRAARWLCAHGFKGAELIHSCLAPGDEALGVGVKLADFPCDQALPRIAAFEALLPFAAIAAQRLGKTCTLSGPMACYALAADGSVWRAPSMGSAPSFQCGGTPTGERLIRQSRAAPDPETLAALRRLELRTYAPATEASRIAGAGAGLSDND
ncbi:MAG TPA: hypothetical protein DEF12_15325 [Rhodobacteraceae bacterium]|jgi:hypothetical protein|nr:hypothetical protein [Paracoccaceae bacterium]HBV56390.1 hypothetical protein [Paracoccaceae bacterium]